MNTSSARIGYARVSTADQNLDAQIAALEKAGGTMIRTEPGDGATPQARRSPPRPRSPATRAPRAPVFSSWWALAESNVSFRSTPEEHRMGSRFYDARLDDEGNLVDPEAYGDPQPPLPRWYVTDPRTGSTQLVEGDAESTARCVAWSQWYATPVGDRDEAHYAALEVLSADENGTLA